MEDIKAQLANRLKEANNVLVSVTTNPSVDQFAAAIALTLILNKLGKHATTVFSGTIPSTIEFLQPEKIVEKNTDSLRDFIISLDKSKADKLRYKIEDNFVKIFITPYHASISDKDLVFSQGDFNVDVVVGIGVHQREELDQAITAHGRILHDATVTTINTQQPSNLGSINWADSKSSSLCEMLVSLSDLLAKQGLFDAQISNALLTGIVAETQRFSNQKTTSLTMAASSKLLAAGANQQLVATELTPKPAPQPVEDKEVKSETPHGVVPKTLPPEKKSTNGELQIDHGAPKIDLNAEIDDSEPGETNLPKVAQVLIDDQGTLKKVEEEAAAKAEVKEGSPGESIPQPISNVTSEPTPPPVPTYTPPPPVPMPTGTSSQPTQNNDEYRSFAGNPEDNNSSTINGGSRLVTEPPSTSGQLNSIENGMSDDGSYSDPLSSSAQSMSSGTAPLLSHDSGPATSSVNTSQPTETSSMPPPTDNLKPNLSDVRNAVDAALQGDPGTIANQPLVSLNAQPINLDLSQSQGQNIQSPIDPAGFESGSNIPPDVISPNLPTQPSLAPPVPPPIIPLNDNNMPPSFTAL